jgi:hypothetical protein
MSCGVVGVWLAHTIDIVCSFTYLLMTTDGRIPPVVVITVVEGHEKQADASISLFRSISNSDLKSVTSKIVNIIQLN